LAVTTPIPVSRLKTVDFPTFGLPASAKVSGRRAFQRAMPGWQPRATYVAFTKIFEATFRPSA
jgi:hypothetical protein